VRWFKVAAFAIGVVIAFLIVSSVIGFLVEALIAVLVVAVVVLAVKVAFNRRQVSRKTPDKEVRGPRYSRRRRHDGPGVEDELTRLKGEMGDDRPV
jgi:membrane protein implicated in regulation of membrane protease activity